MSELHESDDVQIIVNGAFVTVPSWVSTERDFRMLLKCRDDESLVQSTGNPGTPTRHIRNWDRKFYPQAGQRFIRYRRD